MLLCLLFAQKPGRCYLRVPMPRSKHQALLGLEHFRGALHLKCPHPLVGKNATVTKPEFGRLGRIHGPCRSQKCYANPWQMANQTTEHSCKAMGHNQRPVAKQCRKIKLGKNLQGLSHLSVLGNVPPGSALAHLPSWLSQTPRVPSWFFSPKTQPDVIESYRIPNQTQ